MWLDIKLDLDPNVKDIYVIAGLPGMGLSGKQAVDYLIKVLDVEKISSIKSEFLNPPVISSVNGVADEIVREIFTFYYGNINGRNIVLFTGAVQPLSGEWQHIMSKLTVEALKDYDIEAIFTLGATPIEYYKTDVKVYGVATSREFLNELMAYGVEPMMGEGMISGMNGLIIGYAKLYGIKGASLLAETYLKTGHDYVAPLVLARLMSKILKIDIDLSELEERANIFHKEYMKSLSEATKKREKGFGYIS